MSKKIVILNGSPRKKGNTEMLCEAFAEGASSSGHTITQFDVHHMNIHACLGCIQGGKDPASPCMQKDDMDLIYPAYVEADILVFASPMYFWSFTSQLKAVLDRLFAVAETNADYQNPHKNCIMLMAAEGDFESNWKPVLDYYHALLGHLGWKDCGTVLAGGVMHVGDIAGKPSLEEARRLGASIS
jgi:Multimeric flavodoxin WrbA